MAKKQVDGDGLDIPNRIKALPVRRTGPIVAAVIVALFAAMLAQGLITNPRFEWNVVWKYLFNENVLEGIKYTLLLTIISMVIAIPCCGSGRDAQIHQPSASWRELVLYLVLPWHPCVHTVGVLGPVRRADSAYRHRYSIYLHRILERRLAVRHHRIQRGVARFGAE
ncbi:hypothetical protein BIFDEN_00109 [Bifidobacterium dentium ATCC 27678]|nr:hypothetical protein BIFDEN_00109 [Bifidobacterium dentium ATCC 27678]